MESYENASLEIVYLAADDVLSTSIVYDDNEVEEDRFTFI